jgi:hypothetical protein
MTTTVLPLELIELVGEHTTELDLLNLRSTSTSFASIITPLAFRTVTFRDTSMSISTRLEQLSNDILHLKPHVRRIRIRCGQNPRRDGMSALETCTSLKR